MLGLTLSLCLAAGQAGIQLASPGLQSVHLKADDVAFYSDHLAQQLTLRGVPVVTSAEIATLMGLEHRDRRPVGASESRLRHRGHGLFHEHP